jgi:flagellum-specific ATP synthase
MPDVVEKPQLEAVSRLRTILSSWKEAADLINIGAYVDGSNPRIDYAKAMINPVNAFLRQDMDEKSDRATSVAALMQLMASQPPKPAAEQKKQG